MKVGLKTHLPTALLVFDPSCGNRSQSLLCRCAAMTQGLLSHGRLATVGQQYAASCHEAGVLKMYTHFVLTCCDNQLARAHLEHEDSHVSGKLPGPTLQSVQPLPCPQLSLLVDLFQDLLHSLALCQPAVNTPVRIGWHAVSIVRLSASTQPISHRCLDKATSQKLATALPATTWPEKAVQSYAVGWKMPVHSCPASQRHLNCTPAQVWSRSVSSTARSGNADRPHQGQGRVQEVTD